MTLLDDLRSYRIEGMAVFDWVMAAVVGGWAWERTETGSFREGVLWSVPIGIVVHMMLGIQTPLLTKLGLRAS